MSQQRNHRCCHGRSHRNDDHVKLVGIKAEHGIDRIHLIVGKVANQWHHLKEGILVNQLEDRDP